MDIEAQAARSAAQGQQMLTDYRGKAGDYRNQYNRYVGETDAANRQVQDYTNYMKNEGSAANQYRGEFDKQKTELGYDQNQMTAARANLNQAQGALSAYSDFANQAASKWGMNAGGFAAANASALGSINNNIASNQNVVTGLTDLYKTAQTGANQFTGQVIQGQQVTLQGLQQVYTNAADQRDNAASMMNFYDKLASDQGGLNAQQAQYYAAAKQAYASAQQAMAQSALLLSQTRGQDLQNTMTGNYMNSQAYKNSLSGGKTPQQVQQAKTNADAANRAQRAATAQTQRYSSGPLGGFINFMNDASKDANGNYLKFMGNMVGL